RLCLAAEPQAGGREVSAAKAARKTLAYDFFRFLYSPRFSSLERFCCVVTVPGLFVCHVFSREGRWMMGYNPAMDMNVSL
ncbi:hypothetical protein, partial [Pseudomonas aeruginosa]|uniref:hypothetical protein n=1 Tax=Pseudomonas aeruginosa TaxID=287 RepID=UPI002738187B